MKMKTLQNENSLAEDFPWVVFRLGTNQYAFNSRRMRTITLLTGEVTTLPDSPACVRGLLPFRGGTIPMIDLRTIFGKDTLFEEYERFADMLEHRKQDHLHWAEELKRCIENEMDFTLTTDPHQCKFGQWYDHYHDSRPSVNFLLKKIDEPHKRLHYAAVLAQEATLLTNPIEKGEKLRMIIEEVENRHIPQIVQLLAETAEVVKSSFRQLVLVFGDDDLAIGYIVDEVVAVQQLEIISDAESLEKFSQMRYVIGIAQNEQGIILELDESRLSQKVNCQ